MALLYTMRTSNNWLFTSCFHNSTPLVLDYPIPNSTPLVLIMSHINIQQITNLPYSQQHVTGSYTKTDKPLAGRQFALFIQARWLSPSLLDKLLADRLFPLFTPARYLLNLIWVTSRIHTSKLLVPILRQTSIRSLIYRIHSSKPLVSNLSQANL
jgi:hypothetical protein